MIYGHHCILTDVDVHILNYFYPLWKLNRFVVAYKESFLVDCEHVCFVGASLHVSVGVISKSGHFELRPCCFHYCDAIMDTVASQITSLTIVYTTVYSDADQSKHQSSASLAFVWGLHRDRWIPRTKGQSRGKCFHLMTSSCQKPVQSDNKENTKAFITGPSWRKPTCDQ